jgi:hypothetical protein
MARIRSLKPEIIEDEKTGPLTDTAFRLFTSMIILADDHGNVRADVRWLQAQIWWAYKEPPNVLAALLELTRAGLVSAYGVRGGTYAHLHGWQKHQRIDNAGKNRVPLPSEADCKPFFDGIETLNVESPRKSANFGEKPLDPDPDREGDGDVAAKAPPTQKPKPRARSLGTSTLPTDWIPSASERAKAVELFVDCDAEAERFRDHHAAKGSRFVDWGAAFRNWIRNTRKFADERPGSVRPTPTLRRIEEI